MARHTRFSGRLGFWALAVVAMIGTAGALVVRSQHHAPPNRPIEPLTAAYKLTDEQLAHELSDPDVLHWGTAMGMQRTLAACMQTAGFNYQAFVSLPPRATDPQQPGYGLLVKDESYPSADPNPAIRTALDPNQQAGYDTAFTTCATPAAGDRYSALTTEYTSVASAASRTDAESAALASADGRWQACMSAKGESQPSPQAAVQSVQAQIDAAQSQVNATNQLPGVLSDQLPQIADAATAASAALEGARANLSPTDAASAQTVVDHLTMAASQANALAASPTDGQGETKSADAMQVAAAVTQSVSDGQAALGIASSATETTQLPTPVASASDALTGVDAASSAFKSEFKSATDAGVQQTEAALSPVRARETDLATKDYSCRANVRSQIGDPLHDSVARALVPFVQAHREELNALYP